MKMMTDKFFAFRKILTAALSVSVCILTFGYAAKNADAGEFRYQNSETGYYIMIEDAADLLTQEEEAGLVAAMAPLTEYGCIGFVSTDKNNTIPQYYAEGRSHEFFGKSVSQTVFLIDMDNRQIFIYSDNANYKVLTTAKCDIITDNVYRKATAGDYYECAYEAYEQMYKVLNGQKINEPMRYITSAFLAILVAMLVCYIIINVNSKLKTPSVAEILGTTSRSIKASDPSVALEKETKTYSPQSSGGGGGGGGGGHSGGGGGGGHSGGGGGHGF